MKKFMVLTVALVLVCAANLARAGTGLEDLEFTFTYGDKILSNHVGVSPLEDNQRFAVGVVLTGLMQEEEVDRMVKVDDWLIGFYVEHPFLTVSEIPPFPVPIKAEMFAGAEVQKYIGENSDWYFTPYVGIETDISKDISARFEGRYNRRDDIMPEWVLSAGVAIWH